MTIKCVRYTTSVLIALALAGFAGAAQAAKSLCLLYCSDASAKPASIAKPPAAAGVSAGLDTAIVQAQTARKSGDLPGAAKILSQLVLFAPDDPRVLGEYGKTLTAQGRSDDALAFLDRAIQLQPMDWSLYSAQGVAFDQKGAYPSAQTAYSRALLLKPGEPAVLNNAALSHMQSGDLDGAKALLEQASPGTREYPRIADNLALIQHLIASRSATKVGATPPASAVTVAAAPLAPAPVPVPTPAPIIADVPAVVVSEVLEPVRPATVESKDVASDAAQKPSPAYAALQADPTVRLAPLPKEEPAASRPLPDVTHKRSLSESGAVKANLPPHSGSAYYVQAGAYATEARAGKQAQTLDSLGARVSPATVDGKAVYRVRIGPFGDVKQANEAVSQAHSMGQADVRIVSDQ